MSFSITKFLELLVERKDELLQELIRHINMTVLSLLLSVVVGVVLGVLITRSKWASKVLIGIANIMQSIPSIALLAISVCFLGIGFAPAVLMVFVYAFLPILKNTYTGLKSVSPSHLEVAKGIGLTSFQSLMKVELPMAVPFIMAGIRIAAVSSVGTVTIAAFAGAKGLGWFINLGLNSLNIEMILLGAIPVSVLALVIDFIFHKFEQAITSEGLLPTNKIKNLSDKKLRRRRILSAGAVLLLICISFIQI